MIGVIADDLTGAAEIGAIGWRHGLSAEIIRGGQGAGGSDLVCVDTDSRSCTPEIAAERVTAAARMLRNARAHWIYKKVDSVLRGNVTGEVEAVMQELGFDRALLLPANPALGRTIVGGELFIHGRPIHETEFATDPEHPRCSSRVLDLLAPPSHFTMRLAGDERAMPANTLLVAQADLTEQVASWAGALEKQSCLPVGGSGLFEALLDAESLDHQLPDHEPIDFSQGRELFICGTASKSAQGLLDSSRHAGTPRFGLPSQLTVETEFPDESRAEMIGEIIAAFETHRRVILHVGLPVVSDPTLSRRLADHLVGIAEQVLKQVAVTSVFAEGGATASELVRRMNWCRLEVRREWTRGVATLAITGKPTRWLTIKPGSYLWPEGWMDCP